MSTNTNYTIESLRIVWVFFLLTLCVAMVLKARPARPLEGLAISLIPAHAQVQEELSEK